MPCVAVCGGLCVAGLGVWAWMAALWDTWAPRAVKLPKMVRSSNSSPDLKEDYPAQMRGAAERSARARVREAGHHIKDMVKCRTVGSAWHSSAPWGLRWGGEGHGDGGSGPAGASSVGRCRRRATFLEKHGDDVNRRPLAVTDGG